MTATVPAAPAATGRWFGVHPAIVVDIVDPDGQGRVKVSLPWAANYEAWARMATLMAGAGRGSWFIPEVGDEVLVAFEAGDPRWPYVLGGLWNGSDQPPQAMDGGGQNNPKVLRSRGGVKVTLDDSQGSEKCILETPAGQKVTLADGPGSITLEDSNGNTVKLDSSGITVTASAQVVIQASTAQISASTLTVNAGMSQFSGVVQADTVITNSIVSAAYTPGAGNIW